MLRQIAYPLRLVVWRLRAGGQRLLLVAVGIVAASAVFSAVVAGRLVMQDRSMAQATAQLAPADREIAVSWSGASNSFASLDRLVRPQVRATLGQEPVAAMLFREASIQGRLVNLRAADDLGRWVRLTSGRLPTRCVPSHCEVLRLEGTGPIPSTPYLRLIEVGHAVLRSDTPFGAFVLPAPPSSQIERSVRYHTPQPSPVVIANGVAGLSRTTELETFYRSYGWFVPIGSGDVHPWTIDAFATRVQQLTAAIESNSDQFQVTAPTDALSSAAASSTAAARRLLLLGSEGGALLLAFTILAAASLRRDVADARRRLTWFGARRWQVELFTLAESIAIAVAAAIAGTVAGGVAAAIVADRAGSPAGDVVSHALLSATGVAGALALACAAGVLLYATVRAAPPQLSRLALTPLDAAAIGAVAVVLVGWARGSLDASQLAGSGGGTSAFLLLVPALIVFAAAVAAARLLGPALRLVGRAGRHGPIALRLAAASLARNPGHAAVAATFLVASLGLALFAVSYRSTLLRGQHDEATYAVPASFVLTEDLTQLVPVLHGAPRSAYPRRPIEALRLSGNVASGATFTVLGLPAQKLAAVGGWRSDFASQPLAELGRELAPRRSMILKTAALPGGRRFTLPVSTTGDDIAIRGIFRSPLGDYESIPLGRTDGRKLVTLHGRTPFRHSTLAQIELDIMNGGRKSANAGIGIQPSAKGVLRFGTPRIDGTAVRHPFAKWLGTGGVSTGGSGTGGSGTASARLGYLLTPERTGIFRPAEPTDSQPLAVLATERVAAEAGPHGIIPLQIEGEQVAGRIVGRINRFPSIVGDAVVADRQTISTLLDTRSPGLGLTDELWLNVPAALEPQTAATLARAFTQLTVASQASTLDRLEADPLARGALLTLACTAAVALLLALLGLVLSVVGDVRDDRGELFDLEAQGASPATIRAHLRLRALLVAVFGIAGGIGLGAILSALVISLVSVTAGAAEPEPPLRLAVDLPLLAAAAAAYIVIAALLVLAATTLRGRAPSRAAEASA